jgi:hypothetical protein
MISPDKIIQSISLDIKEHLESLVELEVERKEWLGAVHSGVLNTDLYKAQEEVYLAKKKLIFEFVNSSIISQVNKSLSE